jgi:tetratricopeptide (TPR) repeat protein
MQIRLALLTFLLVFSAEAQSNLGDVTFANSGAPAAQQAFLRGLALLHDFEYADAATAFSEAQVIDATFAMAFWGEAMTFNHPVWFQQDLAAARKVLQRAPNAKTERERDYLHTLDVLYGTGTKEERDFKYADAMAELHAKYPDDVDATAFYALSLLGTSHHGRDIATYMRSAALLEEVFPAHRRHPGVLHYMIHSYDDPIHAPLGLRAARLYGDVASHAAHALHMTSHIFVAMGMWDDVIAANKKAMAAHPMNCGHYAIWLEYGYLQTRKLDEAREVLQRCKAVAPADPAHETPVKAEDSRIGAYATMRALYFTDTGKLEEALPSQYAAPSFTMAYTDALAHPTAENAARVRALQKDVLAAIEQRSLTDPSHRERTNVIVQQVDAMVLIAAGKRDEGLALLQKAAEAEHAMPFEFGPPVVEKPTYELLGDQLLAAGRAADAAAAYDAALTRTPGRTAAVEGKARALRRRRSGRPGCRGSRYSMNGLVGVMFQRCSAGRSSR